MKVYVGADHRGFELKGQLMATLLEAGVDAVDLGPSEYNPDDDYNDAAIAVAQRVLAEPLARGVLTCGSGDGMMMQTNRFKRIRAVDPRTEEECKVARWHHNANVLVLSAEALSRDEAVAVLREFLSAPFSEQQRYINRIRKLDEVA